MRIKQGVGARNGGLLVAPLIAALLWGSYAEAGKANGQEKGVAGQRLLHEGDLIYQGAFRVPKGKYGASKKSHSLAYGGASLSFNPNRNSLFVVGHLDGEKMALEMSIPEPVISNDLDRLKTADVLQGSVDLTGGIGYYRLGAGNTPVVNGGRPGSLVVAGDKLIGNAWAYYDGASKAVNSHFTASLDWSKGTNFRGYYRVGVNPVSTSSANGGFVGGYMGMVPEEWQKELGGAVLTGLGGTPVISRSSFGPCAWVFDPAQLGKMDPVPATMLIGYPATHRTLGDYHTGNLVYNSTSEVRGVVFPAGGRTVFFFGRQGLGADRFGAGTRHTGQTTYGPGTRNRLEAGRTAHSVPNTCGSGFVAGGDVCSYDPADGGKGVHAYPYAYRVWAYDAAELAKVEKGVTNGKTGLAYRPWDIVPYATWNLRFPFPVEDARILSATYDPATQRIFLAQEAGDRVRGGEPFPLVHVFRVDLSPGGRAGNRQGRTPHAAR